MKKKKIIKKKNISKFNTTELEAENLALKQELFKYRLPFLKLEAVGEWTDKDRENFRSFMSQGIGAKISATLRQWAISMNSWAIQQPTNNAFYCGMASGFQSCLAKIDEHSQVQEKEPEAETVPDKLIEEQLQNLGIFHARVNGRSDDSLEHLRP